MDKTAIKNFAIWARGKLISDTALKANMVGITESGIAEPLPQSAEDLKFFDIGTKQPVRVSGTVLQQREALAAYICSKQSTSSYETAYKSVIEEVAYTWFNRLIAIRFMEVNDYLPSRVRVLSSCSGKAEPDMVTDPFETDMDFSAAENKYIISCKESNSLDELFRFLFIKQCKKLNDILPELFEKTNNFTELLLNISFTDKDGVIYRLTHDIKESSFNVEEEGQVEIIGWLYQYYNTEPKNEVFAGLKKNKKIGANDIPAATQLFTPHWIVRYMVENSLGRIYVDKRKDEGIFADGKAPEEMTWKEQENKQIANEKTIAEMMGWKYYLPEAKQSPEVRKILITDNCLLSTEFQVEHLKFLDPCMGSGHILVYAFDVLMKIYTSLGYSQRDAAQSIVKNNLYGLEIDKRAAQLAYFAVMMKARQYDRRFLTRHITPNLCAIEETSTFNPDYLELFQNKALAQRFINNFKDAKTYGSIINIELSPAEISELKAEYERISSAGYDNIFDLARQGGLCTFMPTYLKQAEIMAQKYSVVCTNPPYMGGGNMDGKLSGYVKKYYPDSKSDLFAVFIEHCGEMTEKCGYQAMITQHAWMFLSSYEKLRAKLQLKNIVNMAHLGARAFEEIGGEVVQTTSFVFRNSHIHGYRGTYCRLIEPTTQQGKEDMFLAGENRYTANQENFSKIPGSPVAYWVSEKFIRAFENPKLGDLGIARAGLSTGDNDKFLRLWFEVNCNVIGFSFKCNEEYLSSAKKYIPCNKGGSFRRWYGNNEYVVDWSQPNLFHRPRTTYIELYYKDAITWSVITSGKFSARYYGIGYLFDHAAASYFSENKGNEKIILGFLNTDVSQYILDVYNPTLNTGADVLLKMPFAISKIKKLKADILVQENIDLSKQNWDSFETSWDFEKHPLL